MIVRLLLFVFILCISAPVNGQSSISGQISSDDRTSLAFANVLLHNAPDSTFVKGSITDMDGRYIFEEVANGSYYISASMVGFESKASEVFQIDNGQSFEVPTITLVEGLALDEVVVKSTKPLFVQKIDRMVINVESSILSSGSSALEILERSPGVIVNRQNNEISLIGKSGVVILINGRNSNMPQSSIIQLLEGMGSDNIETIELITTPPANFDAEGNAGFVNVVLKENPEIGLNGSYSISGGYGNGSTTSDNISFNYRFSKFNLFGTYSFLRNGQGQIITFRRSSLNEQNELESLNTISTRDPVRRNHNLRLGFDYEISSKTIVGALLNGYDNQWTMDAINSSKALPSATSAELINTELNQWRHFSGNVNLKHNFNKDKTLTIDLDYLYYNNENPTDYMNRIFDSQGLLEGEEFIKSDKSTPINFVVAKTDFSNTLSEKLAIEIGAKATFSDFDNAVSASNLIDDVFEEDPTLTNTSNLNENIFAAYTSLDFQLSDKTSLKTGLRYEHTDTEVTTQTEGTVVDRNFGTFFPTAFISHKINDSLNYNFAYSKRIRRPTINNLAPFVIFIDPTSFITGNPSLRPSISNSIKFDLNYKRNLITLQYGIIKEGISGFQPRFDGDTDRLLFESTNIDKITVFSLTLGLPLRFSSWWEIQNNLVYINTKVENRIDDLNLLFKQNTFRAFSSQTFRILKNLTSELSVNYYGPNLFASTKTEGTYALNAGFQIDFGDTGGRLRFNVNDIWDSLEFTGNTIIPEQNINTSNTFNMSNRTFLLTYSRTFGNKKLKASRDRTTGADDERRRVN